LEEKRSSSKKFMVIRRRWKLSITNSPNYEQLSQQLADLGAELLIQTLPKWLAENIQPKPQQHSQASFTKTIHKQDGKINWNNSAKQIERKIRAYHEWPRAYTFWKNKKLTIFKAEVGSQNINNGPGEVFLSNKQPAVQTGQGILILNQVQLQGKNKMNARDFLNGHKQIIGTVLE